MARTNSRSVKMTEKIVLRATPQDKVNIKKTADIEGVLNQKTLSIQEGASLKIKAETYK